MKKKILAFMMTVVLAMSLAACGDDAAGSGTPNDAAGSAEETVEAEVDPYETALENMKAVTSMDAQMVMEMDMAVGADGEEQSMETVTTMDMVCFTDPVRLKLDMTMDMGEIGSVTQNVYAEAAEDGTYTMYLYDGESWTVQNVENAAVEQYDARGNMLANMDSSYHYVAAGTEQVDGANAYKYTGKITGDDLNETMISSGALDSFSSLGIDESQLESMMTDLGEIPVTMWIDEATLYPVKYEMDMTAAMDKLMANMLEAMGDQASGLTISIPKLKVIMTCSNFNAATAFEIPEEAKAAVAE